MSYSSGPLLGDLEAGIVALACGVRASIVSGGILASWAGLFALALPAFRRYDSRRDAQPAAPTPEPAS